MKFWQVFWKSSDGNSCRGFVKAKTRVGAIRIATGKLKPTCIITGCVEGAEHQITPQSITLNFANESEYKLFG